MALMDDGNGDVTRACLNNEQVLHVMGDDKEKGKLNWKISVDKLVVDALVRAEYDGELLRARFKKKEEVERPITQPRTLERQRALSKACDAGG